MQTPQSEQKHSQEGRESAKNHFQSEITESVNHLLSIHGFDSIKKFRQSILAIVFQVALHPDQANSEIERALEDLQHINRFLGNLEEYEAHLAPE